MVYRAVDTGAGEITARSPYYFGCLTKRSEDKVTEDKSDSADNSAAGVRISNRCKTNVGSRSPTN